MIRLFQGALLALFISSMSLVAGDFDFGGWSGWSGCQRHHNFVIHVDSKDALPRKIALNNIDNLIKRFGAKQTTVELVAYGPGLGLLVEGNSFADRVRAMAEKKNIRFSACNNTIQKIIRETGHAPDLIDGVQIVPSGIGRIVELEEDGYTYIKP